MSQIIHLAWTGPFSIEQIRDFNDDAKDFGVYSIYGNHLVYGANVLLYLGKAQHQTFATRILQHDWLDWDTDAEGIWRVLVQQI